MKKSTLAKVRILAAVLIAPLAIAACPMDTEPLRQNVAIYIPG